MESKHTDISIGRGLMAVSPIFVFIILYFVSSLVIGDFYRMPISVALIVASLWAAMTIRHKTLYEKIEIFSRGAASPNVMYMVWIFILAGAFASIARHIGAVEATVNIAISFLPSYLIVPGLFITTCFISMAIGTSVGTVVALTPLAVEMAGNSEEVLPFYVAIVLGGAFFGDNLSFISDTTIAATRTQGCDMKDKFFANIKIVLPAAIVALILYCIASPEAVYIPKEIPGGYVLLIPYILVIICAICGMNVIAVLLIGIGSACIIGVYRGLDLFGLCGLAGEGIDSVGNLVIITLLASGLLGVIKSTGGIDFILKMIEKNTRTTTGAQAGILLLVGIVNLCTANNTVAILTVGSMTKQISSKFHISPRRSASLLDTGACIVQAVIPYGAQCLMAVSLANLSPLQPLQYLYYPYILALFLLISIRFLK